MSIVISVENISKQYRLGEVGTGTLSHDINRWWHKVRGKEDPYLMIGERNDRSSKSDADYSWALRDISFEVCQGEVLGIIGSNGAGKSTLLKILSRVTTPTTGQIRVKGRIASLLEVGTGFHPELTGRENIFLNGAILGMRKAEIADKLDEIVDFSGCERYIDTPVKRYSSGMYVRLAFAVAAHLDPEILIIDEVLAVGDAEFQKKCLGKMKDVAGEGRTVLFVSHNMASVATLCSQAIILNQGAVIFAGSVECAINNYLAKVSSKPLEISQCRHKNYIETSKQVRFTKLEMKSSLDQLGFGSDVCVEVTINSSIETRGMTIAGTIFDATENPLGTFFSDEEFIVTPDRPFRALLTISKIKLVPGSYTMGFSVGYGNYKNKRRHLDAIIGVPRFEITNFTSNNIVTDWPQSWGRLNFDDACRIQKLG